ncbi:MAG: hypothetical protein QOH12_3095 [Solirubrobacteraceae bacterium]|nr:hypothetical protein [Solirubrobacteraceae bacterium]
MARVLIVGGGCRGRRLASGLVAGGHAVRITTRTQDGRAGIEAAGAECWIGTPDRIGSLRYALENVSLLMWLLGTASGARELHGRRLEFMLSQTIDTTVRGVIYEAAGSVPSGAAVVREWAALNRVPCRILESDPADRAAWLAEAVVAVDQLLGGGRRGGAR